MAEIPTIKIEGLGISKVICGSNPFFGYSHFTRSRDMWMREYFTDERIKSVMRRASELGINSILSGIQERLHKIIQELAEEGHEYHWICTPGGETAKDVEKEVLWCAEHDVAVCMPHQMYTDHNLVSSRGELLGYDDLAAVIRDRGMIPGLSTHRPETIVTLDRAGADVAVYLHPFNSLGFLANVEVEWIRRVISNSPKPIIAVKPLAAARLTPEVGLPFVLRSIKSGDALALGFSNTMEVEEDLEIVRSVLHGSGEDLPPTTSRSKSIF
jgi:hypothetical protein